MQVVSPNRETQLSQTQPKCIVAKKFTLPLTEFTFKESIDMYFSHTEFSVQ